MCRSISHKIEQKYYQGKQDVVCVSARREVTSTLTADGVSLIHRKADKLINKRANAGTSCGERHLQSFPPTAATPTTTSGEAALERLSLKLAKLDSETLVDYQQPDHALAQLRSRSFKVN